jgi:hypothetical protein
MSDTPVQRKFRTQYAKVDLLGHGIKTGAGILLRQSVLVVTETKAVDQIE